MMGLDKGSIELDRASYWVLLASAKVLLLPRRHSLHQYYVRVPWGSAYEYSQDCRIAGLQDCHIPERWLHFPARALSRISLYAGA